MILLLADNHIRLTPKPEPLNKACTNISCQIILQFGQFINYLYSRTIHPICPLFFFFLLGIRSSELIGKSGMFSDMHVFNCVYSYYVNCINPFFLFFCVSAESSGSFLHVRLLLFYCKLNTLSCYAFFSLIIH